MNTLWGQPDLFQQNAVQSDIGLTTAGITINPVVASPTIHQTNNLSATGITANPVVANPIFINILLATEITINPVVASTTIHQNNKFIAPGITTNPVVASAIVHENNILSAISVTTGNPVVANTDAAITYVLVTDGISTSPVNGSPTIVQIHEIGSTGVFATPVVDTPRAYLNIHLPASVDVYAGVPTVDTTTVGQSHTLQTSAITIAPVVGNSGITQIHAIQSPNITTSPVISSTIFHENNDLNVASDVDTNTPTIGATNIHENNDLSVVAVNAGTPTVGVAIVHENNDLATYYGSKFYDFEDGILPLDSSFSGTFYISDVTPKNGSKYLNTLGENTYSKAWSSKKKFSRGPNFKASTWFRANSRLGGEIGASNFKAPGLYIGDETGNFACIVDYRNGMATIRTPWAGGFSTSVASSTTIPTYNYGVWYFMEVTWDSDGLVTNTVRDAPNGTILTQVSRSITSSTSGYGGVVAYSETSFDDVYFTDIAEASPTVATTNVSQNHSLNANGLTVSPTVNAPIVHQTHSLHNSNIVSGIPFALNTNIDQTHIFATTSITASPIVGVPVDHQQHILSADPCEATPVVSKATIHQNHAAKARAITTTPVVDKYRIYQNHLMGGSPNITATPVMKPWVLRGSHHINVERNIDIGQPTIGETATSQIFDFSTSNINFQINIDVPYYHQGLNKFTYDFYRKEFTRSSIVSDHSKNSNTIIGTVGNDDAPNSLYTATVEPSYTRNQNTVIGVIGNDNAPTNSLYVVHNEPGFTRNK